ncbi:hypothetical protein ACFQOY_08045 [Enterococcus alcedinis]|nr:hypothetical protein [Enterococcus alcedinis]MBP2101451.1 hypothetical protein [Enterococcus alcedinis]
MNRMKIEKQLFDQHGVELFKVYHKGYILPLENIQKGIAIHEIEEIWLEEYPYLSYPIFTQEPPVDEISKFTNEEQRCMVVISPIQISQKEVKLGAYGLNQLFYYSPFEEPDAILRINMPHSITDVIQVPVLKIRLKNQRIYPVFPEGNSIGCEEEGLFLREGEKYAPAIELDNRPMQIKQILEAFGVETVKPQ